MTDDERARLRPAEVDEVLFSLSFALRFNGRKRRHDSDEMMAAITAKHLLAHLEQSGYVLMKKPSAPMHSSSPHTSPPKGG